MEEPISKTLTELNFPDMKYEIKQEPHRWVIRLTQTQEVDMLIEIIYEDGGIIACVLEEKGINYSTKSLIMNTLMKHLQLN
jgi:hypothetical protein